MTLKAAEMLTKALRDQIVSLGIWKNIKTDGNLLYEAEWLLETFGLRDEEDLMVEFGYTKRDVGNLRRYAERLRAKGVKPEAWEE